MEPKKSPLLVYREKMAEVHTPEEIKAGLMTAFMLYALTTTAGTRVASIRCLRQYGRSILM